MTKSQKPEPGTMANTNSANEGSGYLILIVDDSSETRFLKRHLLEIEGYRVVEAGNGREGVEAALRERPRLILMNYLMPEMNGLKASTIIHEHPELQHIPIIMNSACSEDEMRAPALNAGCIDYMEEPTDFEELMTKIMSYILVG